MKKLRYIFSFLNKKGVFVFGLVLGIVFSLFFGISVSATTLDDLAGFDYCICSGVENSIHTSYYVMESNYIDLFAGYYAPDGRLCIFSLSKHNIGMIYQCNDWTEDRYGISNTASGGYPSDVVNVFVFDTQAHAKSYLNGEFSENDLKLYALNYNEILSSLSEFDDSLPKIEYLRFNTLSSTGSVLEFGLNDENVLNDFLENGSNLHYYCKVYPIYSTVSGSSTLSSYGNSIVDKVGKWLRDFCGLDTNTYFDNHFHDNGLMIIDSFPTVSNYKKTDPFIIGDEIIFENVFDVSSIVLRIKPLSYDDLTFVGLYCEVYPYADISPRAYGNTVYMQQFIDGDMQATVGLSQNIKTNYDEFGEQITESMGNSSQVIGDDVVLSSDNLLDYVHTGFGLSGSGGYIALMQAFFLGVPAWYWVLVSTALATNLILLSVKVIRGM